MKVAYLTLARLNGAAQMETVVTALATALNSKEFKKAKVKEQRKSRAALNDVNREILSKTQYSQFRTLRNKGTAKEYRPRDRNEFDKPRSESKLKKFRPLEQPPEQQILREQQLFLERQRLQEPPKDAETTRPTLDPYRETDIIVPSDLSAWQLRLLIKTLS